MAAAKSELDHKNKKSQDTQVKLKQINATEQEERT